MVVPQKSTPPVVVTSWQAVMLSILRSKVNTEHDSNFKLETPLEKRKQLSERLRLTYRDRVPVIVEKDSRSAIPDVTRRKFLAPMDISVAKFLAEIRNHLTVPSDQAIYLFVQGKVIPQPASTMLQVYDQYKDSEDGFLYIVYSGENTFGA